LSWKGKTALVTVASRGSGEAIARTLAEHGAHCILVSRKILYITKLALLDVHPVWAFI